MAPDAELARLEQVFRRSGLPLFIRDYSAARDIFAVATPVLLVVGVVQLVGIVGAGWRLSAQAGVLVGAVAALVLAGGLRNRRRGHSFWALPRRVGLPWLAVFVLVPAVAAVLADGSVVAGLRVALLNVGVLAVVVVTFGSGVIRAIFGALGGLADELGASFSGTLRSLPLLVVFALVLFGTTESWQIFTTMPAPFVVVVVLLFWGLGLLFVVLRLRAQINALVEASLGAGPSLRPRERLNLAVVLLVREGLQVLVVALGVAAFFLVYWGHDRRRRSVRRVGDHRRSMGLATVAARSSTDRLGVLGPGDRRRSRRYAASTT